MPLTDWKFEIQYDVVDSISQFKIGNFSPSTNDMNFLDMDAVSHGVETVGCLQSTEQKATSASLL